MKEKIQKTIIQRGVLKKFLSNLFILAIYIAAIYSIIAMVYATKTIYKVKKNYAVVIERFGGNREAVTDIGWHMRLPFFTKIEQEVPLMNQTMNLGRTAEPMRIISKENVTLWTSGALTYRITSLRIWGIENLNPIGLLQSDYDGIVKDILQAHEVNQLISDREQVKEKIYTALKSRPINQGGPTLEEKYGIEIVSFVLKETRFGDKLIEATEEKKRRELIAEAENYAADQEASRIHKLYTAYLDNIKALKQGLSDDSEQMDMSILQFLVQQKWASAYEKNQGGQNTIVIQNTESSPGLNIPVPELNQEEKKKTEQKKKEDIIRPSKELPYFGVK